MGGFPHYNGFLFTRGFSRKMKGSLETWRRQAKPSSTTFELLPCSFGNSDRFFIFLKFSGCKLTILQLRFPSDTAFESAAWCGSAITPAGRSKLEEEDEKVELEVWEADRELDSTDLRSRQSLEELLLQNHFFKSLTRKHPFISIFPHFVSLILYIFHYYWADQNSSPCIKWRRGVIHRDLRKIARG